MSEQTGTKAVFAVSMTPTLCTGRPTALVTFTTRTGATHSALDFLSELDLMTYFYASKCSERNRALLPSVTS